MGFIDRPQQVWWRKAIFQIHLWVGIVLCLYLSVIGFTGSLLVFRDEIERTAFRSIQICHDCTAQHLVSLGQMIATVQSAYPDRKLLVAYMPHREDENAVFTTVSKGSGGSHSVFVSPVSGKIAGETDPDTFWLAYVGRIHFFLLMGETGLVVNGVGAACLLLLSLTGIVVWWPGIRHWKRALGVKVSASWRRVNFDAHSAIGFWTLTILLVWSVSSIYFAWPRQVGHIVEHVSSIASLQPPRIALPQHLRKESLPMEFLLKKGAEASSGANLYGVFMPRGPEAPLTVLMAHGAPGDFFKMDYVFVDPFTGRVLGVWRRGTLPTLGSKAVVLLEQLHFGTGWGTGVKAIWFLLGMSLPVLSITGALMYWNRVLRRRITKKTASVHRAL